MNVIRCNARVIDSALLAGDDPLLISGSPKNRMSECRIPEFQFVSGTSVMNKVTAIISTLDFPTQSKPDVCPVFLKIRTRSQSRGSRSCRCFSGLSIHMDGEPIRQSLTSILLRRPFETNRLGSANVAWQPRSCSHFKQPLKPCYMHDSRWVCTKPLRFIIE